LAIKRAGPRRRPLFGESSSSVSWEARGEHGQDLRTTKQIPDAFLSSRDATVGTPLFCRRDCACRCGIPGGNVHKAMFVQLDVSRFLCAASAEYPPPAAGIPTAQRWGDANCLGHFNLTCSAHLTKGVPAAWKDCCLLYFRQDTDLQSFAHTELRPKSKIQTVD
jgi:hypothetical protein